MTDARERLAKLFGRLGSEHAGERQNGLAAIDKALTAAELSWTWVCELVANGIHSADQDVVARDRLLTRLVGDRLSEAMFAGENALSTQQHASLRKLHDGLKEVRSLRAVKSEEIVRALDLADLVRRRVGRR